MLTPHSVPAIKLPTLFAEFNPDYSTAEKSFTDCSGCENIDAAASVKQTLTAAIQQHPELIWDHWNPQDSNLRGKIAALHGVAAGQVFLTSGAIAGIDYTYKVFSKPGIRTGLRRPDWPGFRHYADFYRTKTVWLENLVFPFEIGNAAIGELVHREKVDLMVLANPVPVQGHQMDRAEVAELLAASPETLFLIDEADTTTPAAQAAGLVAEHSNAIFLGSLSKFYGLSGLRLGYLITPTVYAEHFRRTINVIEVSSLAILAGNVVMDDNRYQQETQARVAESIEILTKTCAGTSYQFAATPHCFGGFLYSEDRNPVEDLATAGLKILQAQYFGLPEGVKGGRFNLSNPEHARLAAEVIRHDQK
jgi:histidinol-phosphate aminotransferase